MAVYKESASVLFWSLAIMTYGPRSCFGLPVAFSVFFPPGGAAPADEDGRRSVATRIHFYGVSALASCHVEFKFRAKCDVGEKCRFLLPDSVGGREGGGRAGERGEATRTRANRVP